MRLDQAETRRHRHRGRHQGVLPRPDHPFQDPAPRPVRRQLSDDGHRQGAEIRHAGDDEPGACVTGAEHTVKRRQDGNSAAHRCYRLSGRMCYRSVKPGGQKADVHGLLGERHAGSHLHRIRRHGASRRCAGRHFSDARRRRQQLYPASMPTAAANARAPPAMSMSIEAWLAKTGLPCAGLAGGQHAELRRSSRSRTRASPARSP